MCHGNEKALYLEISDDMITGKGIIYLESSQREYSGDIDYELKTVKKVEQTVYEGLDALVIHVRVPSLYGVQKIQVRLPGIRDMFGAMDLLNEHIASFAPKPVNVSALQQLLHRQQLLLPHRQRLLLLQRLQLPHLLQRLLLLMRQLQLPHRLLMRQLLHLQRLQLPHRLL